MRYLGGKSRLRKKIAAVLHPLLTEGQFYYEPVCGACPVAPLIVARRRILSDAHAGLVAMWSAMQKGFVPPSDVSEDTYAAAKRGELSPELTAFIGFGCSFGGKYFGGYARAAGRNWADESRRACIRKAAAMSDAEFSNVSYLGVVPPSGSVVYCDPPYDGTEGYAGTPPFDSAEFWNWVRQRSASCRVIVSEYKAPPDFDCIAEFSVMTGRDAGGGKKSPRIERLFTHATRRNLQEVPEV